MTSFVPFMALLNVFLVLVDSFLPVTPTALLATWKAVRSWSVVSENAFQVPATAPAVAPAADIAPRLILFVVDPTTLPALLSPFTPTLVPLLTLFLRRLNPLWFRLPVVGLYLPTAKFLAPPPILLAAIAPTAIVATPALVPLERLVSIPIQRSKTFEPWETAR